MANSREIFNRMKSVNDTMKITNAMYMISSSKRKKAMRDLENAKPHFIAAQDIINDIERNMPESKHPFFGWPENKAPEDITRAYIVITGDKGLAGAYNHNVLNLVNEKLQLPGHHILFPMGKTGQNYFVKKGFNIREDFCNAPSEIKIGHCRLLAEKIIDMYMDKQFDEIDIIFTNMVSSIECRAISYRLLPLRDIPSSKSHEEQAPDEHNEEINFLPSPEAVLKCVVPNYLVGILFGAMTESFSSEQNARMQAMDAATNNAKEMIKDLNIAYNSARQAAITQEITEIISGAKALKRKVHTYE